MAKAWADIDAKRKRYNPEVEGYGNAHQWTGAFYERIGVKEAEQMLYGNKKSPRQILGVDINATWQDISKAFRKLALATHPDRISITGMSVEEATEAFKTVSAAYTMLCEEFGK